MNHHIRSLSKEQDSRLVAALLEQASDYFLLIQEGQAPSNMVDDYFNACPPNCDPQKSLRLGYFVDEQLMGVAEVSFGFPEPNDVYLGLMLFAPEARGQGFGRDFLNHIETATRKQGADKLYLAVYDKNVKGCAFWHREGFTPTGVSRIDTDYGAENVVRRLVKHLL